MFNSNDKFEFMVLKERYEDDILFVMNKDFRLYSINSSGIEIYNLLKEEYSLGQIINYMLEKYRIPEKQLCGDIYFFIDLLLKNEILSLKAEGLKEI